MSTKTFPYSPFGSGDNLLIFLVISVFLHLLFALGLVSLKPVLSRVAPREKEPVVVDVVDLPSGPAASPAPPKKFTHYADRNQTVDKETYPEPSKKPALQPVPAPLAGSKGKGKEASSGAGGAKGEMKNGKGSPAKESATIKKEDTARAASKVPPKASLEDKTAEDSYRGLSKTEKSVKETAPSKEASVNAEHQARPLKSSEPSGEAQGGPKEAAAKPARPNLFPTPERITELEKRYEAEAPQGEKGKTLQLNTSELRYQKYLMNMKRRIEFYWEYPDVASRSGWQGVLNINFTINKDGTVSNITIGKSSNYPVLDDAAVTAIRLAAPFPPFPDNFGIEEINIKGQFEYKIYGGPHEGG